MADKTVRPVSANRAGRQASVRTSSGNKARRSRQSKEKEKERPVYIREDCTGTVCVSSVGGIGGDRGSLR